jgi:hypothetical protein
MVIAVYETIFSVGTWLLQNTDEFRRTFVSSYLPPPPTCLNALYAHRQLVFHEKIT